MHLLPPLPLSLPLSVFLTILLLSTWITPSMPQKFSPAPDQQPLAAAAAKWALKPFHTPRCTDEGTESYKGSAPQACTPLAVKFSQSNGFRFSTVPYPAFKLCLYNQAGCADQHFCGMSYGHPPCGKVGAKGPAVAFRVVDGKAKCGGAM